MFDRHSGRLYVSGVNWLYQLSSNLTQQSSLEELSLSRNYPKTLTISYQWAKLISCGSGGGSRCEIYNISAYQEDFFREKELFEVLVPSSEDFVFVAPGLGDFSKEEVNQFKPQNF